MRSAERIYHGSVRALSIAMVLLGVAIAAATLVSGGGPASVGLVIGLVFVVVGAGRLWLAARMQRGDSA